MADLDLIQDDIASATGASTLSVSFTSNTVSGNSILGGCTATSSGDTPVTSTINGGSALTRDGHVGDGTSDYAAQFSISEGADGTSQQIDFVYASTVSGYNAELFIIEAEGATSFDQYDEVTATGVHNTTTTPSLTGASSPCALMSVFQGRDSLTGDGNYTNQISSDGGGGYQRQTTATADTCVWSHSNFNGTSVATITSYVVGGGGGGRTTKNTQATNLGVNVGMNWRGGP